MILAINMMTIPFSKVINQQTFHLVHPVLYDTEYFEVKPNVDGYLVIEQVLLLKDKKVFATVEQSAEVGREGNDDDSAYQQ